VRAVAPHLLLRWFVGLVLDDSIWDHSTFSKNRDRLPEHQVAETLSAEVMRLADGRGLLFSATRAMR